MPEISGNSLFVLVQLLDEKMRVLRQLIDAEPIDSDHVSDWEEELFTYSEVAMELKAAYESCFEQEGNLPPYSSLLKSRTSP